MTIRTEKPGTEAPDPATSGGAAGSGTEQAHPDDRRPYAAPRLEPLGAWSVLTLQQSIPIFP